MADLIQLNLSEDDVKIIVGADLVLTNEDMTLYLQFGLDQFCNIIDDFLNLIGEATTEELKNTILSQQNKIEELEDRLDQYKELYD